MEDSFTSEDLQKVKLVMDVVAPYYPPRDYRKECWIAAYNSADSTYTSVRCQIADEAVKEFDKRFPS